jgi:hypothetical protein
MKFQRRGSIHLMGVSQFRDESTGRRSFIGSGNSRWSCFQCPGRYCE